MSTKFQPGKSGNPRGRPTDAKKSAAIRKLILNSAPEFVGMMIDSAKAGDVNAGRALLVCACPPLKPVELPVTLPMDADAGIADQGRSVINALAQGLIAPGQASQILTALAGIAKLIELEEFERRLSSLEAK